MTDPMQFLDDLARRAREEMAPEGDVSEDVVRKIRETGSPPQKPNVFFTIINAVVAAAQKVFRCKPRFS